VDLISKRDLDQLPYNRELMRRASWTAPSVTLGGEDFPLLRRFAQETYGQMKALYPDLFKDKTIDDWEKAIRVYLSARRPEFREEILGELRKRYKEGGKGEPSTVLVSKAMEELQKKSEANFMDKTAKKKKSPSFLGTTARGAGYGALVGGLVGLHPAYKKFMLLRNIYPNDYAAGRALRVLLGMASGPTLAGALGGAAAYPFIRKQGELEKDAKEYDIFNILPERMKRTRGLAARALWSMYGKGPFLRALARALHRPSRKSLMGMGAGAAIGAPIPLPGTTALGAGIGAAAADAPRVLAMRSEESRRLPKEVVEDLVHRRQELLEKSPKLRERIVRQLLARK